MKLYRKSLRNVVSQALLYFCKIRNLLILLIFNPTSVYLSVRISEIKLSCAKGDTIFTVIILLYIGFINPMFGSNIKIMNFNLIKIYHPKSIFYFFAFMYNISSAGTNSYCKFTFFGIISKFINKVIAPAKKIISI